MNNLAIKIVNGDYKAVNGNKYSEGLNSLIGEMLRLDGSKRPSIN